MTRREFKIYSFITAFVFILPLSIWVNFNFNVTIQMLFFLLVCLIGYIFRIFIYKPMSSRFVDELDTERLK